jgi:hypothetical protein
MRAHLILIPAMSLVVGLGAEAAFAKSKDAKDHVMGAIWEYTITREGQKESGTFRVYKKEIFLRDKVVGAVDVKDEDETALFFTAMPELNGKAVLRKTRRHPTAAVGTLKKDDGTQWEMRVVVKEN